MMSYVVLGAAILVEVIATTVLKAAQGFTRPLPTVVGMGGYILCAYLLSVAMRAIPVGIAYATWAGLGIVLVTLLGVIVYGQKPDLAALVGLGFIILGVILVHVFSKMS